MYTKFFFHVHELFFDWSQCRSQSLTPALLHHYTIDYGYIKIHNCISQFWMLHLISSWSWCWPFFLEEQKYSQTSNLYRPLTKIYVANKHNKSGFKIKKIITYMSKVNLELTVCLLNRSVKTFLLFWTWSLSCILFSSF